MIKQIVKKAFNLCGLNITYKNKQRDTFESALNHLLCLGFQPSLIIDVGTALGTPPLTNTYPQANFIWIEPLFECEKALKELTSKFKGKYILAAAGKINGKSIINVHKDKLSSSLYSEIDGPKCDGTPREVDVIRLDSLIEDIKQHKSIILKIDVQGKELDVLEGAEKILESCNVVIVEISFFKFFKDNPTFFDIVKFMKKRQFVVYDTFDKNYRPLDKALGQIDLIFVKEEGYFRKTYRWASDEQRGQQ
tara:strand:+ start:192 stop:941 length:750 start_codon:yes stop_codon:yes gene_type:complete